MLGQGQESMLDSIDRELTEILMMRAEFVHLVEQTQAAYRRLKCFQLEIGAEALLFDNQPIIRNGESPEGQEIKSSQWR